MVVKLAQGIRLMHFLADHVALNPYVVLQVMQSSVNKIPVHQGSLEWDLRLFINLQVYCQRSYWNVPWGMEGMGLKGSRGVQTHTLSPVKPLQGYTGPRVLSWPALSFCLQTSGYVVSDTLGCSS